MVTIQLKDHKYARDTWLRTYQIWARQKKTQVHIDIPAYTITFEDDMMATIFMLVYPHNR